MRMLLSTNAIALMQLLAPQRHSSQRQRLLKERQRSLVRRRIPCVFVDELAQLIGQQSAHALAAPRRHCPRLLQQPGLDRYRNVRFGHHTRKIREEIKDVNQGWFASSAVCSLPALATSAGASGSRMMNL